MPKSKSQDSDRSDGEKERNPKRLGRRIKAKHANASPKQSIEKAKPKEKATTPEPRGVAAPSLCAWSLGKQGFDLLQLGLKHTLHLLAMSIQLSSHLGLQGRELSFSAF